ncbi:MAG: glycosyltransferase [Xenococcaceae cyanobacterium MO_188.B32]|nr:glycosyltransferase [Xenococcaceae cyanobacterium MO_188.B32]
MKKLMFYCQHILGIGHLIRSREIVRGLAKNFQVCFINGGEIIPELPLPDSIKVVNLPALKTDTEFSQLQPIDSSKSLEETLADRQKQLLEVFEKLQPEVLVIELFPFGRKKFTTELVPLLEIAKTKGTKVVCSLRDIVVRKKDQKEHEEKVCHLINRYFDSILLHGDRNFISLEESFSRVKDLKCNLFYTGYVVEQPPKQKRVTNRSSPMILVSVGGGRFGHDLIESVIQAAPILQNKIPHHIQIFTGAFAPEDKFSCWQAIAEKQPNLIVERYTPELLSYMQQADLSISMSGYNTTMNILMTGVRAMIMPFTGNGDQEQTIRANKLQKLGRVKAISPEDLQPEIFANQIIDYLNQQPNLMQFDFNGVANTAACLERLLSTKQITA